MVLWKTYQVTRLQKSATTRTSASQGGGWYSTINNSHRSLQERLDNRGIWWLLNNTCGPYRDAQLHAILGVTWDFVNYDHLFHPLSVMLTSGTKSMRLSRSSSCNLSEIPGTGPLWIRFIRWVTKPAILFRMRFDGMMATSSHTRLFVWKSIVKRE